MGWSEEEENAGRALLCEHALASADKQQRLVLSMPNARVYPDLESGTITYKRGGLFGKRHRYRAQILAFEDERNGTWSWAWDVDHVAPTLARGASVLRAKGEREQLAMFATPTIPVASTEDAMMLALIAVGVLRSHFYWRVDAEHGGVWLVVSDPDYEMPSYPAFERFCEIVESALGQISLPEHRTPLLAYARWLGLRPAVQPDGTSLTVEDDGATATLAFDAMSRVQSMDIRVG